MLCFYFTSLSYFNHAKIIPWRSAGASATIFLKIISVLWWCPTSVWHIYFVALAGDWRRPLMKKSSCTSQISTGCFSCDWLLAWRCVLHFVLQALAKLMLAIPMKFGMSLYVWFSFLLNSFVAWAHQMVDGGTFVEYFVRCITVLPHHPRKTFSSLFGILKELYLLYGSSSVLDKCSYWLTTIEGQADSICSPVRS